MRSRLKFRSAFAVRVAFIAIQRGRRVLSRSAELVLCSLREIFDENAYQRFLQRRGLISSRAAYAEFLLDIRKQRERQARCC